MRNQAKGLDFFHEIWYNRINTMYNWSTHETTLKKDPKKHAIWRLKQMINFGIGKGRINKKELELYWSKIRIDPARRKFLNLLLHGTLDS